MGWDVAAIADVCEPVELRDPRQDPAGKFHYVDISGIDRTCKVIAEHQTLIRITCCALWKDGSPKLGGSRT